MSAPFADFAAVMRQLAHTRGATGRWARWTAYLDTLAEADRQMVEGWRTGIDRTELPLPTLKLSAPASADLLVELSGWDREVVDWCQKAEGSVAATYRALLPVREDDARLTLAWVADAWAEAGALRPAQRIAVMRDLLAHASPESAYVLLQLLRGQLAFPESPERPLPPPLGTCHLVITAASGDHAERSLLLTDYTIAAREQEHFLSVGTVWEGLDDDTIEVLTRLLISTTVSWRGNVSLVQPKIVLEIAHNGVRPNGRRQSGYELIAPRIVRWCRELGPEAVTPLAVLLALALRPSG